LASFFLVSFSLANMEASMFLYVSDKFAWDLRLASFGFAYVGILMAFTQGFLIRKLLPKFGEGRLLLVGVLMFGAGMFIVGLADAVWLLAVGMTILALGNGCFN